MIAVREGWELDVMRSAGRKLAEVVARVTERVAVGMTTKEIDAITEDAILAVGAKPAFKGYKPGKVAYPASICISINEQVVHGVPGKRRLHEGDLVSLDFGLVYGGYYADTAFTLLIPPGDPLDQALLDGTREALYVGIAQARHGRRVGDIGYAIENYVTPLGFGVVTDMVGHGIGRRLHEEPSVPNYGRKDTGAPLVPGMVIAIEPMITRGGGEIKTLADHWTVATKDNSRSAHFEHTVAITPKGPEILTTLDPVPLLQPNIR